MDNRSALLPHSYARGSLEANLTPQPLHIYKRRHQRNLSASSECLPMMSDEPESPTSSRQPSVQKSRTQIDLSRRKSSSCRDGTIEEPLNVRKQRRSDPVHAASGNTAAGKLFGVTLSYPPARPRRRGEYDVAPSMRDLNLMYGANNPVSRGPFTHKRALTVPSTCTTSLLNPFPDRPSIPPAPTPSIASCQRRAVTLEESQHSLAKLRDPEFCLEQAISNQPPLKQSWVSRVMNGLTNRPKASYGAAQLGERVNPLHKALPNISYPSNQPHPVRSRSDTISSIENESILGGDLDTVIAAFPTPPSSSVTSPTTLASPEISRMSWVTALRKPEDVPVIGAELSIIPELLKLSSNGGQSMYVAIEIAGVVAPLATTYGTPVNPHRLDVAVIIDNSLFASPATLLASCETARFLATLLDPTSDRMTICKTMPVDADIPNPKVVSPLSEVTVRDTKSLVDTIVSSTDKPDPGAMSTTIDLAKSILTQSRPNKRNSERVQSTLGHIFVLSSRFNELPSELLRDDSIQIHLICPGSVPWKGSEKLECCGWKLRPHYTNELQFLTYNRRDTDATSLFNRLRGLISRARRGACSGTIKQLVLDINAGPECSIEAVMGNREISFLQPGEVVTALVKLRAGAPAKGYSLSPSQNSPGTQHNSHDLTEEIDGLLGTFATTVLAAELRYKHSLLPSGTLCTVSAESRLKREDPCSSRSRSKHTASKPQSSKLLNSQISVQKRLVYYLATHSSPRHAISTLALEFGEAGRWSVCPQYIKLISEELKYQARIIDRFDLANTGTNLTSKASKSPFEHFGQGLFDISNYKPQDWLTAVPDENTNPLSSERRQRRQSSTKARPPLQNEDDVKRAMKKMSGGRHYVNVKLEREKERRSREEALKVKQNVGVDASKSVSGKGRVSGAFAAWV